MTGGRLGRQLAHVAHEGLDVGIGQPEAEGRHARPANRRAAVLDEVEEVTVRPIDGSPAIGQVARPDEEQGGPP
jgi:hypothetical protein